MCEHPGAPATHSVDTCGLKTQGFTAASPTDELALNQSGKGVMRASSLAPPETPSLPHNKQQLVQALPQLAAAQDHQQHQEQAPPQLKPQQSVMPLLPSTAGNRTSSTGGKSTASRRLGSLSGSRPLSFGPVQQNGVRSIGNSKQQAGAGHSSLVTPLQVPGGLPAPAAAITPPAIAHPPMGVGAVSSGSKSSGRRLRGLNGAGSSMAAGAMAANNRSYGSKSSSSSSQSSKWSASRPAHMLGVAALHQQHPGSSPTGLLSQEGMMDAGAGAKDSGATQMTEGSQAAGVSAVTHAAQTALGAACCTGAAHAESANTPQSLAEGMPAGAPCSSTAAASSNSVPTPLQQAPQEPSVQPAAGQPMAATATAAMTNACAAADIAAVRPAALEPVASAAAAAGAAAASGAGTPRLSSILIGGSKRAWSPSPSPAVLATGSAVAAAASAEPVSNSSMSHRRKRVRFNDSIQVFVLPPKPLDGILHGSEDVLPGNAAADAVLADYQQQLQQAHGQWFPTSDARLLSRRQAQRLRREQAAAAAAAAVAAITGEPAAAAGGGGSGGVEAAFAETTQSPAATSGANDQQLSTLSMLTQALPAAATRPAASGLEQERDSVAATLSIGSASRSKKKKRRKSLNEFLGAASANPSAAQAAAAAAAAAADADEEIDTGCFDNPNAVFSPWHKDQIMFGQPLVKGSEAAADMEAMMREEEGLDGPTVTALMGHLCKETRCPSKEVVQSRIQRFKAVIAPYRQPSMMGWLRRYPRLLLMAANTMAANISGVLSVLSPGVMLPAAARDVLDKCPQLVARTPAATQGKVDLLSQMLGQAAVCMLLQRLPVVLTLGSTRLKETVEILSEILAENGPLGLLLAARLTADDQPLADPGAAAGEDAISAQTAGSNTDAAASAAIAAPDADASVCDLPSAAGTVCKQSQHQGQEQTEPQAQPAKLSQQQPPQATAQVVALLLGYPGIFITPTGRLRQRYKRFQGLLMRWQQQGGLTAMAPGAAATGALDGGSQQVSQDALEVAVSGIGLSTMLAPLMLQDHVFELLEHRIEFLLATQQQSTIRIFNIHGPNGRNFEDRYPGFAAWRQQHKGVAVSTTLGPGSSSSTSAGSSGKGSKRNKAEAGHAGGSPPRRQKQQKQQEDEDWAASPIKRVTRSMKS